MEYWRYVGSYYCQSNEHHHLYCYGNRVQWLYQNGHAHGDGQCSAQCGSGCCAGYNLYRPKQYHHCIGGRHIRLEHRRYNGFHYGQPGCHHHLYCHGHRRQWMYQDGNGDGHQRQHSYTGHYRDKHCLRGFFHYADCFRWYFLSLEYGRYDSSHQRQPKCADHI